VGLLFLNLLRRRRWLYGLAVPCFLVPPLATGFMIGAWSLSGLSSREILLLPVSRKEIWRTRWILALLPVVIGLFSRWVRLGAVILAGGKPGFSASWPLLIFLFQLSTLGMLAFMSGPIVPYIVKYFRLARQLRVFVLLGVFAVALEFVFISQAHFREMHEWSAGIILLLAAGLFVTAISFFHSPQIAPRFVLDLSSRESQGVGETRSLTKPRATGLTFFAWNQLRGVLAGAIVSGVGSQLPTLLLAWWVSDDASILESLSLFSEPVPVGALILLVTPITTATGWICLGPDLLGLRQLRVLPISTRTLAAVLTVVPMLFWLCFWMFPVAGYWMIFGHWPPALRLELLSGLTGLTCLVESAVLLSSVAAPIRILPLPLCMAAGFGALHLYGAPLTPVASGFIGILGLAGIAASFVLNARALCQSSAIYKSVVWRPAVSPVRLIAQ
jgi:hypothetical protein